MRLRIWPKPRTPSSTFLGSRAVQRLAGWGRCSAPRTWHVSGVGGRRDPRETLAGPALALTRVQLAAWLEGWMLRNQCAQTPWRGRPWGVGVTCTGDRPAPASVGSNPGGWLSEQMGIPGIPHTENESDSQREDVREPDPKAAWQRKARARLVS